MDSYEHVCTPACDTFYDEARKASNVSYDVDGHLIVHVYYRALRTAFVAGLVLGLVLAALAAVAVAVIR